MAEVENLNLSEEQIRAAFTNVESCIDHYFEKAVVPQLDESQFFRETRRVTEIADHPSITNLVLPTPDYSANVVYNFPAQDIEKVFGSPGLEHDIQEIAAPWQVAAMAKIGEERYKAACEELGTDLAEAYVRHRLMMRAVDREVEKNPINGSADFISREAKRTSLLSSASVETSNLQKYIDKKCVEKYDPNLLEKGTGLVLGEVTDLVLTAPLMGHASWLNLGKWLAIDVGFKTAGDAPDGEAEFSDVNQIVNIFLYDKQSDEYEKIRQESHSLGLYTEFSYFLNDRLNCKYLDKRNSYNPFMFSPVASLEERLKSTLPDIPDYSEKIRLDSEIAQALDEKFGSKEGASSETEKNMTNESAQQSVNGWDGLLDSLGLSDFGVVGKNFGYVLAMLPDLLIGMFTGQTKRLNISDNLMPIAAIFGGMFVKNPILKTLLIGLGGANLLNKAGHEALDHANHSSSPVRMYKPYDDEALDRRIQNPVMRGNTLVADIDGQPLVLPISDMAVDAYEKGVLPLNTLSNAVLRAWDNRQEEIAQNYEQSLVEEEARSRSRGIQ